MCGPDLRFGRLPPYIWLVVLSEAQILILLAVVGYPLTIKAVYLNAVNNFWITHSPIFLWKLALQTDAFTLNWTLFSNPQDDPWYAPLGFDSILPV